MYSNVYVIRTRWCLDKLYYYDCKIDYTLLLSLDTLGRQHSNNSEIFYYPDFVSFATAHSQPELLFSYIALGQASHAPQPDSTTQDGVASASASCFEVLLHKSHKAQPLCSLCRQREHTWCCRLWRAMLLDECEDGRSLRSELSHWKIVKISFDLWTSPWVLGRL